MPFGAIFGALFLLFLGCWSLLGRDPGTAALQAARLFLALLALGLALGLLLRRRWARWGALIFAAATAVVVLVALAHNAGVGELVVLFGSVTTALLLAAGPTGDVRRGLEQEQRSAPRLGRSVGLATTIGVLGLAGSLGWGTLQSVSGQPVAASRVVTATNLPQRVRWADFETGRERAIAESRPMLVTFVTDWCGYCRKMDRTTWNDPAVVERVSELVAVRVDAEVEGGPTSGRQLAARYGVDGYPTTLLLEPGGRELSRRGGYVEPRAILNWIDGAVRAERPPMRATNLPATGR